MMHHLARAVSGNCHGPPGATQEGRVIMACQSKASAHVSIAWSGACANGCSVYSKLRLLRCHMASVGRPMHGTEESMSAVQLIEAVAPRTKTDVVPLAERLVVSPLHRVLRSLRKQMLSV